MTSLDTFATSIGTAKILPACDFAACGEARRTGHGTFSKMSMGAEKA